MAEEPRLVALDRIDPAVRTRLLAALQQRPIARVPGKAGKGMALGIMVLALLGFLGIMHYSNLVHGSPAGRFYSPWSFAIAGVLGWLGTALIIGHVQAGRRLARAPYIGKHLVGTSVVIATEDRLQVYRVTQCEVRSGQYGTKLFVPIAGNWFVFTFGTDRDAIAAEQQVVANLAALRAAQLANDHAALAELDPFAGAAAPTGKPARRGRSRWLLALPAIAVAIAGDYGVNRAADAEAYARFRDRYGGRGGRRDAELAAIDCNEKVEKADALYLLEDVIRTCPAAAAAANAKIDRLRDEAAKAVEALPPKARAVFTELLVASKKDTVGAHVIVHGPPAETLAELDELVGKVSPKIAPPGKTFDAAGLASREAELGARILEAINSLAPHGIFRVVDAHGGSAGVDIDVVYTLIPLLENGELMVYNLESDGKKTQPWQSYVGLTIYVEMTMTTTSGAVYTSAFEAPPAYGFDIAAGDELVQASTVYQKMVDTALDAVSKNLAKDLFR